MFGAMVTFAGQIVDRVLSGVAARATTAVATHGFSMDHSQVQGVKPSGERAKGPHAASAIEWMVIVRVGERQWPPVGDRDVSRGNGSGRSSRGLAGPVSTGSAASHRDTQRMLTGRDCRCGCGQGHHLRPVRWCRPKVKGWKSLAPSLTASSRVDGRRRASGSSPVCSTVSAISRTGRVGVFTGPMQQLPGLGRGQVNGRSGCRTRRPPVGLSAGREVPRVIVKVIADVMRSCGPGRRQVGARRFGRS
jgi:hypothetical protein